MWAVQAVQADTRKVLTSLVSLDPSMSIGKRDNLKFDIIGGHPLLIPGTCNHSAIVVTWRGLLITQLHGLIIHPR